MRIMDLLEETYTALSANKARSALTMLGIIIGIASVIAMTAVGQGAQKSIQASIQSAGANMLTVYPGQQRGIGTQVRGGQGSAQTLTQDDVEAIKKTVTLAKGVSPELSRRYQITTKGANTNTQVIGTTQDYATVRNFTAQQGTFLTDSNVKSGAKVAVLGPTTRDDLFGADVNAIGKKIRINSIEFTIIGVTTAKGGSGFSNPDDSVFIPITTAQRYLTGNSYVSSIGIQAPDEASMTTIQTEVTALLNERHKIKDPALADFNILNQADIVATASSVTSTFTTLLAAIASISLLVGGVGIMNMMLTTVTERTREIGLRKAIGAEEDDISLQFLLESVALTFIGGTIGIALGWLIAYAIERLGVTQTSVSLSTIGLAFGVSAAIGILFGYYPARRAAMMNPIEALRFE